MPDTLPAARPITLLIVDPNVSLTSPSMRGVVLSLPELKARGFNIEVWCWHCDEGLPVDKVVRLPRFGRIHTIGYYAFSFWAALRSWWLFRVKKEERPPEVVYTDRLVSVALRGGARALFSVGLGAASAAASGIHSLRDVL